VFVFFYLKVEGLYRMTNLYYIHDPMCSWCYAFDRVLKQITAELPESIDLVKLVGGLAPDSTEPMSESLAAMVQGNWKRIEQTVPHIQFNFDFWVANQAIRSTYPACRAVLAAKKQSSDFEDKMIAQIQRAYYKEAGNPSLDETLINCAKQIGLKSDLFISDYKSEFINEQLLQELQFVRHLGVSSYPSLCLEISGKVLMIAIDYNNADYIIEQIHRQFAKGLKAI